MPRTHLPGVLCAFLVLGCVAGVPRRDELIRALLQVLEIDQEELRRDTRNFFLFNVDKDRIDLVLQKKNSWGDDFQVGITYWQKGQESSPKSGLSPTPWAELTDSRIPSGPLVGYRYGVVIGGLQPHTTYVLKEDVYKKQGQENYHLISNLGQQREYTTLSD